MTLHVSLPPQLEELVRRRVESGRYGSASEVVREALRLFEEHEKGSQSRFAAVRQAVRQGITEVERGQTAELDIDAFLNQRRQRPPS